MCHKLYKKRPSLFHAVSVVRLFAQLNNVRHTRNLNPGRLVSYCSVQTPAIPILDRHHLCAPEIAGSRHRTVHQPDTCILVLMPSFQYHVGGNASAAIRHFTVCFTSCLWRGAANSILMSFQKLQVGDNFVHLNICCAYYWTIIERMEGDKSATTEAFYTPENKNRNGIARWLQ